MKNILSCTKTAIILLLATVISLGFYAFLFTRPISYGMNYYNESVYDGEAFEGTLNFNSDGTMISCNSNFSEKTESRYYYKDGYVFFTLAMTDEEYEKEVASINESFDEAVAEPFYASKINAFKQISEGPDGYATTYTCTDAVVLAIAFGVVELALLALTAVSFILLKKSKCK